jgi:hypothetical protein
MRKGPTESASITEVGTVKTGNDGRQWIVKQAVNGVKRWVLHNNKPTKASKAITVSANDTDEKNMIACVNEYNDDLDDSSSETTSENKSSSKKTKPSSTSSKGTKSSSTKKNTSKTSKKNLSLLQNTKGRYKKIAPFIFDSSEIIIVDPVYGVSKNLEEKIGVQFDNILQGTWYSHIRVHNTPTETYLTELLVLHSKYADNNANDFNFEYCDELNINTQQVVIVEKEKFGRDDCVKPDDCVRFQELFSNGGLWYELCCNLSIFEPKAGVIAGGVVCSAGYRENNETHIINKTSNSNLKSHIFKAVDKNKIIAMKVVFTFN